MLKDIDPSELVQWDKYLVQSGDTLTSISESYMIDYELLKEINGLDDNLILKMKSYLCLEAQAG